MITMITNLYYGSQYVEGLIAMAEANARMLRRNYPLEKIEYLFLNDSPKETVILPKSTQISVQLVENHENLGIHRAKLKALEHASGEYVFFLDQDDKIAQDCILTHLETFAHTNAQVSVSNGYREYETQRKRLYAGNLVKRMVCHKWWYIYGTDLIFTMGQCMIRKEAIPEYWRKNPLLVNGSDDFYLWLCMFAQGVTFCYTDKEVYTHVETMVNYSNDKDKMDASFLAMCELLSANPNIKQKDIKILRQRLAYKRLCQNKEIKKWRKIEASFKNFPVVLAIFLYKIAGYE